MSIKTFIDYIISDDPNKYPDGAVHTDGYYYERVVEGAKVAHGSTTTWSNIEHKLGVKPTKILVMATGEGVVGGIYNGTKNFVRMDDANTSQYHTGTFSNVNETTFSFSIINMYTSFTYYWIAIAE